MSETASAPASPTLSMRIAELDTRTALRRLEVLAPAEIATLLAAMPPARANTLLAGMAPDWRARIIATAPAGTDWSDGQRYAEGTVGRLLEDPPATFPAGTPVAAAVESLREVVKQRLVTYLWVVDADQHLLGVVAFRDLLYAERSARLDDIMIRAPFALRPTMSLVTPAASWTLPPSTAASTMTAVLSLSLSLSMVSRSVLASAPDSSAANTLTPSASTTCATSSSP